MLLTGKEYFCVTEMGNSWETIGGLIYFHALCVMSACIVLLGGFLALCDTVINSGTVSFGYPQRCFKPSVLKQTNNVVAIILSQNFAISIFINDLLSNITSGYTITSLHCMFYLSSAYGLILHQSKSVYKISFI